MDDQKGIEKVREMADDIKVCMLVTEDKHGHLRSRPMHTTQIDEQGKFWFFTNEYSTKVEEIKQDMQVNLAYANTDDSDYLSISGTARVTRDQEKIDELWSKPAQAWFPEGKNDPKIALLCFTPAHAEYWDATESKLVQLFKMGKAIATGKQYQGKDSGKVQLA